MIQYDDIYINLHDYEIKHHPEVIKKMSNIKSSDYFTLNYDIILLNLLVSYVGVPSQKMMLISSIESFIKFIMLYHNFHTVRMIHPLMEKCDYLAKIPNVNTTNNFKNITEKLVILCNPSYPTGDVFTFTFVNKIIYENPNSIFVIDESYMDYLTITERHSYSSTCLLYYHNIFVVKSFKPFGVNSVHYVLSSHINIEQISKKYYVRNIIPISKIYILEILRHIDYYKNIILSVQTVKLKLHNIFNKYNINYILIPSDVIVVKSFDVNKLQLILSLNNIIISKKYSTMIYTIISLDDNSYNI